MVGQNIGLSFLIPLALEKLAENPLASGDFYPGDLLKNVLDVKPEFWQENPELYWKTKAILFEIEALKKTIEEEILPAGENFNRIARYSK